jgi:protein-tyrosine kinase
MSRIHDALKKAELERTGGLTPENLEPPTESGALEATQVGTSLRGASENAEAAVTQTRVESMSPVTVDEALLANCAQPAWNPDPKTMLFFDEQNRGLGTEQFRTLRSHLYLLRKELPLKRLLITSPLPKEGKTFVAGNLAQALVRQEDRRVLLVDADLRMSGLHLWLGAPSTPGLSDYLSGGVDEFAVIQRGPIDNFFFVPAGKSATNPSELIGNGRLKVMLDRLAPSFDWIILDSPPATLVSDAKLLAEVCDGVLMVVLASSTPFDLAQKSCQEFRGRRILGVALNRSEGASISNSFQYYNQARHGDQSGEGKPPKQ